VLLNACVFVCEQTMAAFVKFMIDFVHSVHLIERQCLIIFFAYVHLKLFVYLNFAIFEASFAVELYLLYIILCLFSGLLFEIVQ